MRAHLKLPDGSVDLLGAVVERSTGRQSLSPLEVAALSVLAEAAPAPVTEAELLQKAWGYRTTNTRTVSMAMSRLRKKLEKNPRAPTVLLTVRGVGYQLHVDLEGPPRADPAPSAPQLLGRSDELRRARAILAGERGVELIGPGGIGKSTVARALVPGAIWVDLDGVRDATAMWRRLVGAFDAGGEDAREAVHRLWAAQGGALVLDGCEQLDADAVAQVEGLREPSAGRVVITSRKPLGLAPAVLIEPVSRESARGIIAALRRNSGLPPLDDTRIEPMLTRFGGHPLALVLAAPLLDMDVSSEEILELRDEDLAATLRGVLEQTVAQLPAHQRELLAVAACFVDPPDLPVLARVTERPRAQILRDVQFLRASGLLTIEGRHLHLHPFIRQVTASDQARARYRSWVAGLETLPIQLARRRNDIENALDGATGRVLQEILLRHALVLDHQGPKDGLLTDVEHALTRAPDDARSAVIRSVGLLSLGATDRARAQVDRALAALPVDGDPSDTWWRAYAVVAWEFCIRPSPGTDAAAHYQGLIEQVRPGISEPYVWALLTLRLAWLVPERAAALRREVLARRDLVDTAFTARVHQAWQENASLPELDAIEQELTQIGPSAFSSQGWGALWCFLIRVRIAQGDVHGAMDRYRGLPERYRLLDPLTARRQAYLIAILLARHPSLAREVAGDLGDEARSRVVEWLCDPVGDPPAGEHQAQLRAWRDGTPLPGPPGAVQIELSRMPPGS